MRQANAHQQNGSLDGFANADLKDAKGAARGTRAKNTIAKHFLEGELDGV